MLANIFAVQREPIEIDDLKAYLKFLSDMFPIYIATDFGESSIGHVVQQYPTLYHIHEQGRNFVISAGIDRPNLKFFNSVYSDDLASYLQKITKFYMESERIKS